ELGGVGTSYAANKTSGATTTALTAGDLTLNGFQVGASSAGLAAGQTAASAFSVAAAINAISPSSGVTAVANANTVAGGTISAYVSGGTGDIGAGTFSINGVNVGDIKGGASAAGQGANVAAAINKIANQTGVTATASATDGKLTLSAADGRDISIGMNGTAADLATAANNKTTLMNQTGLASANVGTKAVPGGSAVAQMVGSTNPADGANFATVPAATGTITDLMISVDGGALIALAPVSANGNSTMIGTLIYSRAITAYNTSGQYTGIAGAPESYPFGSSSGNMYSNNFHTIAFAIGNTAPDAATAAANRATLTALTGLSAAQLGSQAYLMTAQAAVAADNHGTVTLTSASSSGIVYAGAHADRAGLSAAGEAVPVTVTSSVSSIASMNVLTAENATKALSAIDGALGTVNASRAALGSIQNRFTSVVTSLQTTSENLSSSRSRIQDADFAAETAALSRAQVLQQAGTAMVAQANQLPQGVLALLR
ncbi:MAG: flagellin, partial [Rhodoferax sp.]|uniref:flagellin n=1 Tax=Rhodoferax sp. TaxID=50421 RepID=UPI003018206C